MTGKGTISGTELRDRILRVMDEAAQNPAALISALEQKVAAMEPCERKLDMEGKLAALRERERIGTISALDVLALIGTEKPKSATYAGELRELGFPEQIIREAIAADECGLFNLEPSADLVERVVAMAKEKNLFPSVAKESNLKKIIRTIVGK
jgi:hypothetical protein